MTAYSSKRLRFSNFEFERFPKGRCSALVELERPDGTVAASKEDAIAAANSASELRCAAQATLGALEKIVGGVCRFELLGVKAVKAFETTVVIVALSAEYDEESLRLVGSVLADEDTERAAALAVLNATNRFLGNPVFGI